MRDFALTDDLEALLASPDVVTGCWRMSTTGAAPRFDGDGRLCFRFEEDEEEGGRWLPA